MLTGAGVGAGAGAGADDVLSLELVAGARPQTEKACRIDSLAFRLRQHAGKTGQCPPSPSRLGESTINMSRRL